MLTVNIFFYTIVTGERVPKRARRNRSDVGSNENDRNSGSGGGDRDQNNVNVSPSNDAPQRTTNNSNNAGSHKRTAAGKIGYFLSLILLIDLFTYI